MTTTTTTIPEFAACPAENCAEGAKFNSYTKRYHCRSKQHGSYGYDFTNDNGVCEGRIQGNSWSFQTNWCKHPGKPEPAMIDSFTYGSSTIIQVPNKEAGKFYCGIHSPAKKEAKEAKKRLADHQSWTAKKAASESHEANKAEAIAYLNAALADDKQGLLMVQRLLSAIDRERYSRFYS